MSFPTTPVDNEIAVVNGISYIYNTGFNSWTKVTPNNLNLQGNVYITGFDSLSITANSVLPKSYTDGMSIVFGS
jgi:hypothetical protein